MNDISRDFTVAVFVVDGDRVLLRYHRQLQRWLPPGGHIEPNELPDEAAVREVLEETGVRCTLAHSPLLTFDDPSLPRQLARPAGIQLESIRPGHEHIDLIYFARGEPAEEREQVGWYASADWTRLSLTAEVRAWCERAIAAVRPS